MFNLALVIMGVITGRWVVFTTPKEMFRRLPACKIKQQAKWEQIGGC